jgi:bifunctional ADP-heptose synthase (sugar kinase/adenylyltransferase)
MIHFAIGAARQAGVPVMVDPKDDNFFSYGGVTIFKPNLREVAAKVPFPVDHDLDSLRRASTLLRERLANEMTCITLAEGGIFIDDGKQADIYPTRERDVVDVSGAGDAVLSILTLGYLCDLRADRLAFLANAAGGLVCEETGVTPVTKEGLMQEIGENFL